ncbi:MAG: phospholipase D-like domain-containing protein [Thermodesulfobacteriota bacterium]
MKKNNNSSFQLKIFLFFFLFLILIPSISLSASWPVAQLITDTNYFPIARKIIQEAKSSIRVMMFEMAYYEKHPETPSNLLIKELIAARQRGIKVEVILEVKESRDRTTVRNQQTGKILAAGGVEVIYDSPLKTMHAKCLVVDEQIILLGSTNWTFYALTNNNEVSILMRSPELARELIEYFKKVKVTGQKE